MSFLFCFHFVRNLFVIFRMCTCEIGDNSVDSLVKDETKHDVCDGLKFQKLQTVDVHRVVASVKPMSLAPFEGKK